MKKLRLPDLSLGGVFSLKLALESTCKRCCHNVFTNDDATTDIMFQGVLNMQNNTKNMKVKDEQQIESRD